MLRLGLILTVLLLWAQEERTVGVPTPARPLLARLSGRVIESRTGEALAGVRIQIGSKGAYSDDKGTFVLPYEGEDTLTAFLIGYRPLKVAVRGAKEGLILRLEPVEAELEEVPIVAEASRESEAGLFLERMRSLEIGEYYSQELVMKRSTDFYVPNVLRRLPGVSLLSGRYISIRGMGERYNAFAFWAAYPAWLTYDASFGEIEQLITTLLGRVEVRKFWTPELLGHFGGGMVDFQLPTTGGNSLQVAFTSEVDIGGIGRAYPLFRGPVKEPLPSDFPPPAAVIASENQGNPTAENFAYGRQFRRYTVPDSLRTGLPGGLITLAYDKRSETWRFSLRGAYSRRYLSSSIQFQDGNFLEENGKWRFEPVLTTEGKQPLYHYSQGGGASFSVGWQPNPAHNLNAEGFFIANTPQRIAQEKALYINPAIDSVRHVQSYYTNFLLQRSYMGILRTSWRYSLPSGWQISTQLGWIAQHHQIPQTGAMNYVRYPNSSQIAYEQELYGESEIYAQVLTSRTQANQFYAHPFIEKRWGTTQRWVQLRLGAWASLEEQRHRSRQLGFMSDTAGGAPNVLPPSVYAHDNIRDVYNPAHIRPGGWYLIERTGDYHRHRGLTQTVAGYGWLRIGWNNRWESMIGVRYEGWRRQLFHIPIALPERETLFARLQDAHLLPIFLTKYQLSEQQSLRFGANMTLIRPPLPTQVPLPYFDYVWAFYWVGVPNLPTGRSYNADLRYEWLRSKDKLIALGLFYKQLYRLPEVYLVPASFNLTYTYSTRERRRGEVLGVELELREVLWEQENHRLWGYLNLTLSESAMEKKPWRKLGQLEGRLQGHAPIVGNAGLLYSLRGWEIAFFANYTSAQIWAIGFDPYIYPHVIEEQRWLIESQVSYRIHERWEIRLAIWDLLNMPYRRTQRLGNANSFQPDRDNLSIWERWAYRGYLTIRYLLQS